MSEHLVEHVTDWRNAVLVERTSRTIRNVALAGVASKNGYRYAESALQAAASLYENVPVFLDHPVSPHRPRNRSARDLAGSVANVRYESGRLRGDLRTLDTEAGRTLLALAEADGPGVGMSHVVLAERSRDGATVERIFEVVSVDAVAFPATTRTFRESRADDARRSPARRPVPLSLERKAEREAKGERSKPVSFSLERGARGEGFPSTSVVTEPRRRRKRNPASGPQAPRAPLFFPAHHRKKRERIANVRALMRERPRRAAESASDVPPGGLERLLASIDAALPGHLRRLASSDMPRHVRIGLYPDYVLVERRTAAGLTERHAVAWRLDEGRPVFGDELIPFETVAERLGSWANRLHSPRQERRDDANARIERLTERLRETTAERDRLVERLETRGPTSVLRRRPVTEAAADDLFIRAIRRR